MAILNITYNGVSFDYSLNVDERVTDMDVRRIAVEVVRSGEVRGLHVAQGHGLEQRFHVVGHQIQLVHVVLFPGMDRDLRRRQAENQPTSTHIDVGQPEHIAQERAVSFRV